MVRSYEQALSSVDVIWASPYIRAQQTAELVASHLPRPVITQAFLPPNGCPDHVVSVLMGHSEQTVLIVSHQPLVGILVDQLAGLEPGRYRMGTGALAYLTTDIYANGCCDLQWLHQPLSTQAVSIG